MTIKVLNRGIVGTILVGLLALLLFLMCDNLMPLYGAETQMNLNVSVLT